MKFLTFMAVLLIGTSSVYAGNCDIFASRASIVVQSAPIVVQSAPVAYGSAFAVPANVQVQNYANVQYVPQPVVLQSAVAPLVQPYAITSVQPVIGVQSFAPTGASILGIGGYGGGNAIIQQSRVQILSNGHHNNGVQVLNLNNRNNVQVLNLNNRNNLRVLNNRRNNNNVVVLNNNRHNNNNNVVVLNNNRRNNNIVVQNVRNNVSVRRGLFGGTVVRTR